MERDIIKNLIDWKEKEDRKPLILRGARQVGKTWIMKYFAENYFENFAYFNMENNKVLYNIFDKDFDTNRIINELKIYSKVDIKPNKTLIIFDEIQEVPKAITSLKYFNEENNSYHIICAGSLLGIALHNGTSFPVGKVQFENIYPLSFKEYLKAKNFYEYAKIIDDKNFDQMKAFKNIFIENLKEYFFVGGMPEVVATFIKNKNYLEVRTLQQNLISMYENDFSKHISSKVVPRIREVFLSISRELGKENKKFVYSNIKKGARSADYEEAIMWLKDCGLVYKINRMKSIKMPTKAYEEENVFKLYLFDIGLLSCINNISMEMLLYKNDNL